MTVHVTAPMLAAYNHFISVGFIENGAGAAVGNFCQESGEFLIATMFRAHPDFSGGVPDALKSGGIAEWLGDRKTSYIAFSGRAEARLGLSKGSLLNDLGTQCDFVVYELQTNPRYATLYHWLTVDTGRSVATLTYNFCWIYEDPAKETANLDNRVAHAEAVVAKARLLKATPVPVPAPPAPIPQAPEPSAPRAPPPIPAPRGPPGGLPPISASTAGRQAAILDNIGAMRAALVVERDAINNEIAILDKTAEDFGKLPGVATALQPPLQITPAANQAANATQGKQTVLGITNWQTTLSGLPALFTAAIGIFNAIQHGQAPSSEEWGVIGASISSVLIGINAKDKNVTGGSVPQTNEAKARATSTPIS